ncbi:membrane protein YeiH [Aquipluma nitroreducens]|uniref:Membrane protein YeiH n=1 Tax=Aquipluma nitroreducens TaxID=2010828 RepID=A0A5K7S9W8_9BACT|nr:putative sulfate exporter family transporter [Aquipluma nitroreducens]BBE18259.1 membrane protein YeiH [Aquipluma nitroreducens]
MNVPKIIYIGAILICAFPFIDTPFALLIGIILAQTIKHPFHKTSKKLTHILLQVSVVGLGFGMNAWQALDAGKQGLLFTIFSIVTTLTLGLLIGKRLKVENNTSYLISTGTAICGGSAIAAISSIIKSNEKQISTALGTVFVLNSVALFLFPWIGHLLHLSQHQFGVWAAIAIHDTSSVVGAANQYGAEALQIATTIKLERALWIIPLAIISVFVFKSESKKVKIPYFIFLFVLAMLLNTFVPAIHAEASAIVVISKIGLKITLFLIGSSLSKELVASVGIKPLIQGVLLWAFISVLSLVVIIHTVL